MKENNNLEKLEKNENFKFVNCMSLENNSEIVVSERNDGESITIARSFISKNGNKVFMKGAFHMTFNEFLDFYEMIGASIEALKNVRKDEESDADWD